MSRKRDTYYNASTYSLYEGGATYEEAISATGFGKFNLFLLIVGGFPICQATVFSLSNLSQIIPSLKCDFNMTLHEIGILNATPFLGNIASPFLWGFLADRYGRRKEIIWTCICNGVCEFVSAFSVNLHMLIAFKFMTGFLITAPFANLASYVAECHTAKIRSRMIMVLGILLGTGNFFLPAIAWAILPLNINNNFFVPWRIYILVTSIPSFIGGISMCCIPESPKFLMASGRHDDALEVFQKIYSSNTGKPGNSYPITKLACYNISDEEEETKIKQAMKENCQQFIPLFHKPYLMRLILSLLLQSSLMMGANTLRIWLPQILTLIDEHKKTNSDGSTTLCQIILLSLNKKQDNISNQTVVETSCSHVQNSDEVYIALCMIGIVSIVFYIFFTITSSIFIPKYLLVFLVIVPGVCSFSLIWIKDPIAILVIAAGFTILIGVGVMVLLGIIVDLFPTSFRTTTVLLCSTSGRITSVLGNLILPVLFQNGCFPAFIFLGGGVLLCLIPLFLLPSEKVQE